MILCDHHIQRLVRSGKFVIDPPPNPEQYDSSSVNLRVGDDFRIWKSALRAKGTMHSIDLDNIDLAEIIDLTDPLTADEAGIVAIPPGGFVLVRTLEHVSLPLKSKLAARVEGRSKLARLGLTAHITAPTIHAGFSGKITLEILNHGPFELKVRPNHTQLCQLIIEQVSGIPRKGGSVIFSQQSTPLGTPKRVRH
ncbi:MAG: dCTP deaminase [Gemmataceae bacterium]|nr:dCTP deaminase [Gemmataceae bacterium]MCI0737830.1 dCTP deaminase [Gemmataceae bacterium]